jgi:hypothetical protein
VSSHARAHGLPSFPPIRIIAISPFHLPLRRPSPASQAPTDRPTDRNPRWAGPDLVFPLVAAARNATVGF